MNELSLHLTQEELSFAMYDEWSFWPGRVVECLVSLTTHTTPMKVDFSYSFLIFVYHSRSSYFSIPFSPWAIELLSTETGVRVECFGSHF